MVDRPVRWLPAIAVVVAGAALWFALVSPHPTDVAILPIQLAVAAPPTLPPPAAPAPRDPLWRGVATSADGAIIVVWTHNEAFVSRDDGRNFRRVVADASKLTSAAIGHDGTIFLLDAPLSLAVVRPGEAMQHNDIPFPFIPEVSIAVIDDALVAIGLLETARMACWMTVALSYTAGAQWKLAGAPPAPTGTCTGPRAGFVVRDRVYLAAQTTSDPADVGTRWVRSNAHELGKTWSALPFDQAFANGAVGEIKRDGWLYFQGGTYPRGAWQSHPPPGCTGDLCAIDPAGAIHAIRGVRGSLWSMRMLRNDRLAFVDVTLADEQPSRRVYELTGDHATELAIPDGMFSPADALHALRLDERGQLTGLTAQSLWRWTRSEGWRALRVR